jgi:hypothetical protein
MGWAVRPGLAITTDKHRQRLHAPRGAQPGPAAHRWPAATSTPSPPAASSTATTACWRRWRWCARSTTTARDRGADRGGLLDQRRRLALRAGDDGLWGVRRRLHAGARPTPRRTCEGQDGRRRTAAHRLRWVTRSPAPTPSVRTSRRTSNRARCSRTHGTTIGVVTGVLGIRWYDCTVTGMEAHAGPTPMALRKDALQAATRMMQEVVAIATATAPTAAARWARCRCTRTAATSFRAGEVLHRPAQRQRRAVRRDGRRHARRVRQACRRGQRADVQIEPVSAYPAQPFDAGCVAAVASPRPPGWAYSAHAGGVGRRARRGLPGPPGARRHDLRALQGRHQPQRDRGRQPEHLELAGCNVLLQAVRMLERAIARTEGTPHGRGRPRPVVGSPGASHGRGVLRRRRGGTRAATYRQAAERPSPPAAALSAGGSRGRCRR